MMKLSAIENELLKNIADLHKIPSGAVNIRKNGEGSAIPLNIEVRPKSDKPGIDVIVAQAPKKLVHSVMITMSGY